MLMETHVSHVNDNKYLINNILFQQKKNRIYIWHGNKTNNFRDTKILSRKYFVETVTETYFVDIRNRLFFQCVVLIQAYRSCSTKYTMSYIEIIYEVVSFVRLLYTLKFQVFCELRWSIGPITYIFPNILYSNQTFSLV